MPPAKETRAHMMVLEKNRMNKSISGNSGQVSPGKSEPFKMRRFRDVQSKIAINNTRSPNQRHTYLQSAEAQDGEDF